MTVWIPDLLRLVAGIVLAWAGGELFVRGLNGLSLHWRVPPRLVGVTLGAFATSAPELSVAVHASLSGMPVLSVGDVTGSNVVNVALILGVALLAGSMPASWREVSRDFLTALAVPLILAGLLWDGTLSRADGVVLLLIFLMWLATVVREGLRRRQLCSAGAETAGTRVLPAAGFVAAGLGVLIVAGDFIVAGASGISLRCGMSQFAVGAVIVAAATGTPELATTIIARVRGHHDLGLGNILGSNIFNGLFIVGLVALLAPCPLPPAIVAPALAAGFLTTLLCVPVRECIPGRRGWMLLAAYGIWLAVVLRQAG